MKGLLLALLGLLLLVSGSGFAGSNFGLDTSGGHGGQVLKVSNLNTSGSGSLAAAVVGNILRYGRDTYSDLALVSYHGAAYLADNLTFNLENQPMYDTAGVIQRLTQAPVWPKEVTVQPAATLEQWLLPKVGAHYWQRDPIDLRIIAQYQERSGRIIDSQQQVGGYPQYLPVVRPLTVPEEHINEWLSRFIPVEQEQK